MKPFFDAFIEHVLIPFWFMPHGYILAYKSHFFHLNWRKSVFRDPNIYVMFSLLQDKIPIWGGVILALAVKHFLYWFWRWFGGVWCLFCVIILLFNHSVIVFSSSLIDDTLRSTDILEWDVVEPLNVQMSLRRYNSPKCIVKKESEIPFEIHWKKAEILRPTIA